MLRREVVHTRKTIAVWARLMRLVMEIEVGSRGSRQTRGRIGDTTFRNPNFPFPIPNSKIRNRTSDIRNYIVIAAFTKYGNISF